MSVPAPDAEIQANAGRISPEVGAVVGWRYGTGLWAPSEAWRHRLGGGVMAGIRRKYYLKFKDGAVQIVRKTRIPIAE